MFSEHVQKKPRPVLKLIKVENIYLQKISEVAIKPIKNELFHY